VVHPKIYPLEKLMRFAGVQGANKNCTYINVALFIFSSEIDRSENMLMLTHVVTICIIR
jgi:hypothetical protein